MSVAMLFGCVLSANVPGAGDGGLVMDGWKAEGVVSAPVSLGLQAVGRNGWLMIRTLRVTDQGTHFWVVQ